MDSDYDNDNGRQSSGQQSHLSQKESKFQIKKVVNGQELDWPEKVNQDEIEDLLDQLFSEQRFFNRLLDEKFTGKLKIYKDGVLLFEGEFLKGKRNGKGRDFYRSGVLLFEGEFLNGERNGKGKEYYPKLDEDGKPRLKYEGIYKNGRLNGKVKKYDTYGVLEYEGEFLNGERNGYGKEYNDNGFLIFEGEYKDDKRTEKGIEYLEGRYNFNDDEINREYNHFCNMMEKNEGKSCDYNWDIKDKKNFLKAFIRQADNFTKLYSNEDNIYNRGNFFTRLGNKHKKLIDAKYEVIERAINNKQRELIKDYKKKIEGEKYSDNSNKSDKGKIDIYTQPINFRIRHTKQEVLKNNNNDMSKVYNDMNKMYDAVDEIIDLIDEYNEDEMKNIFRDLSALNEAQCLC